MSEKLNSKVTFILVIFASMTGILWSVYGYIISDAITMKIFYAGMTGAFMFLGVLNLWNYSVSRVRKGD